MANKQRGFYEAIDLLLLFMKSDANPEKVKLDANLPENVWEHDDASNSVLRELSGHNGLLADIRNAVKWAAEKEKRHREKKLPDATVYSNEEISLSDDPNEVVPSGENQCDICYKTFATKHTLKTHKKGHLDDEEVRKPFKCEECGRRFTTYTLLVEHNRRFHLPPDHPSQKVFECEVCGKFLSSQSSLIAHKKTHLDENDPKQSKIKRRFKCKLCDVRFRTAANLRHHMNLHTGIFAFTCEKCDKGFNSNWMLKQHLEKHENGREPLKIKRKLKKIAPEEVNDYVECSDISSDSDIDGVEAAFKCEICNTNFKLKGNFLNHMRRHNDNVEETLPFKCDQCEKRFFSLPRLQRHARVHSDKPREEHPCDICGKNIISKQGLSAHKLTHLDESDPVQLQKKKPFKCDKCGSAYASKYFLNAHVDSHHSAEDPRKVECGICKKLISSKYELKRHEETHLDKNDPKRRFECDICHGIYRSLPSLNQHMKLHDSQLMLKSFECTDCGQRFGSRGLLERHSRRHLPENDPSKRRFTCDICLKKYHDLTELKRHKTMHLDENDPEQAARKRPFKCGECGDAFRRPATLRHHMNYHTGNFPFNCELCAKGFNTPLNLKTHMESHKRGTIKNAKNTKRTRVARANRPTANHEIAGFMKTNRPRLSRNDESDADEQGAWSDDAASEEDGNEDTHTEA